MNLPPFSAPRFLDDCAARIAELSAVEFARRPLCVAPNFAVVSAIRGVAAREKKSAKLPRFCTLSRLAAAQEKLPPHFSTAAVADCAANLPMNFAIRESVRHRRLALEIYNALPSDGNSPSARFARADEIARLFAELTDEKISLPQGADEFLTQLGVAHSEIGKSALGFEARLTLEMWRACLQIEGAESALLARQRALAKIADAASLSMIVIDDDSFSHSDRDFFARYAKHQPVEFLSPNYGDDISRLFACWNPDEKIADENSDDENPASYFADAALVPADSLDAAADDAAETIRRWLRQNKGGKKSIAVVAFDRALARRLRAKCEREKILLRDETGWAASTLSFGAALRLAAENSLAPADAFSLLEILRTPGFFGEIPPDEKDSAARELRNRLADSPRGKKITAEFLPNDSNGTLRIIAQTFRNHRQNSPRGKSINAWLQWLDGIACGPSLKAWLDGDRTAAELTRRLNADSQFGGGIGEFSGGEFLAWLAKRLEEETLPPDDISSPVVITPLESAWLRRFDGVVLLGADSRTLPSAAMREIFSDAAVVQLGLDGREKLIARQRRRLAHFLANNSQARIMWRSVGDHGEKIAASPYFELLKIKKDFPRQFSPPPLLEDAPVFPSAAVADGLPCDLSASECAALIACPYRWFAANALNLRDDSLHQEMDAATFGGIAHAVIAEFLRENGGELSGEKNDDALLESLKKIARREFGSGLAAETQCRRFLRRAKNWLAWEKNRAREGWRCEEIEFSAKKNLPITGGESVLIRGRIDRIDRREKKIAVLDYKTGGGESVRRAAQNDGEKPQLGIYAWLLNSPDAECGLIAFSEAATKKNIFCSAKDANPADGDWNYPSALMNHFADILRSLADGKLLPANGAEKICRHCEMRGLCRKSRWSSSGGEKVSSR